jgi:ubiquinone/menaquinone biosynthesis C-methylase UbiE
MAGLERSVEDFERAVLAQEPVPIERYDAEYFSSGWREGGNRYDLETRRRVEARNPELIKEVFRPQRVLDVGCGPGFLMHFLHELGVSADGIDGSAASLALAPGTVRDRIIVGPVTRPQVPPASYDLVVCREVLEHLTVLQIRRTVTELCRASSRFVYVTTRFHPDPDGLLDFTSEPEVDPTHISLLAKDLLRCMFVLEGFRRRADLEDAMDWARKGRVLVYERAPEA